MNKAIYDFIEYAYSNLIWFAFNFVLVLMPLVALFKIHGTDDLYRKEGNFDINYGYLLGTVACVNFI